MAISSTDEVVAEGEGEIDVRVEAEEVSEQLDEAVDEARHLRSPHDPGKPTRK